METNFKTKLYDLLKKDVRLWDKEKKEINETLLKDLIDKLDEKIIELLLGDKEAKEKFFIKIKDVFVLKQNDLKFFIDENKLANSYTQYQNKIGLRVGNKLLTERDEVVLNWPFKDCVLEGGMTKEDQKRNEIFFNEVLAKDEIDRLFDPKALVNWKRHTAKGEEKVKELKRDKDGTIRENLIIKGNNLLALHSLKEQFTEKVKLIYIDPPYNTGGATDTFSYNNNFKHSAWLSFISNRLKIAKELINNEGFIALTIDHEELFYVGTIMDEIFGRENRVGIVTIFINPKGRQHERFFSASTEYMLVYAKNINLAKFNKVAIDETVSKSFDLEDKEGIRYRLEPFARVRTSTLRTEKPDFYYPIYVSPDLKDITSVKQKRYYEIFPIQNGKEYSWKTIKETFNKRNKNEYFVAKKEGDKIFIYHQYREQQVLKNIWINKKYFPEFQGTNLLKKILGSNLFSYPKSLYAVLDTLKIMTNDDDIVLDFFAGSGTTAHAVEELNYEDGGNRKFIICEQMDYVENVTKERMKIVIDNFKNSSLIYCELAKWNEEAKEKILKAKSLGELEKLFDEIYERYFLNYNVKTKEFKEKTLKEEEFLKLGLDKQKKLFVEMLDMNQMYVNFSERADKKYNLSQEDVKLSEQFYSTK